MYRVTIYDNTGTTPLTTIFEAKVYGWSKRINAPGKMSFSIPLSSTKATDTNLRKYRQVNLLREKRDGTGVYETVWTGYIQASKDDGTEIQVVCMGNLGFFKKRLATLNQAFTGQGSTEAFGLLTTTNSTDGATGITSGTGGVTTSRNVTAQGRIDILRAWELLAQAHTAEFEIDDSRLLNFVTSLGTDKSATVKFRYRRDGVPGSNIKLVGLGEDGEPMANRIISSTTAYVGAGNPVTKDDATSQASYPVLIEQKQFNEAQNATALDAMAGSYLTQRANPITDYRIEPILATKVMDTVTGALKVAGLQYGDVVVGDFITVDIVTENQTVQTTKRIAEIDVTVDENEQERVLYTLSKSGVFVTESLLDVNVIADIKRRIKELEALV